MTPFDSLRSVCYLNEYMVEREDKDLIADIEQHMGLAHGTVPTWGYDLNQRIFSEEAPTRGQRRFAGWCLRNLSFFVSGYDLAVRQGQALPLSPSHVQAFFYLEREEMRYRWGDQFHPFELGHVLGAAKRNIRWLEELKRFEETPCYDRMLERLRPTLTLLEQAVQPPPRESTSL